MVQLLETLQNWPPEALWPVMLAACFGSVLILHRVFGAVGLQVYVVISVLAANLQVLKAVQFGFFAEPVALGTVMFSSSYLATDLLAERYGPRPARTAVFLGFAGYSVFVVMMLLTLGFAPLTAEQAGESMAWAVENQTHLEALFLPAPALFAAGMIAYLTSQLHDVWLFDRLNRAFAGRHLWLPMRAVAMTTDDP
ncbi:MAG: queuosine precursor transporter [Acidobacteriota bacterium]